MPDLDKTIRTSRGPCPDPGDLLDFIDESLTPEDRRIIGDHLALCGWCANEVRLLRESEPVEPTEAFGPSRAERARMRRRFRLTLRGQGSPSRSARPSPKYLVFALACAIVLLVVPAYIGIRQLVKSDPGTSILQVLHLDSPVRDASGSAPLVVAKSGGEWAGLIFWVPVMDGPDIRYACRLQKGSKAVIAGREIRSFDGLGNFLIAVRISHLDPGTDFELVVTETGGMSREWHFPFSVSEAR